MPDREDRPPTDDEQARAKLDLEIDKLKVDIRKVRVETLLYPLVVISGATVAAIAVVRFFGEA